MSKEELLAQGQGISCHSWNADKSMIAISPNNNEIHIYETKSWKRLHLLSEHDLMVSAIDWSDATNKIVSCSHDRNAFVWTYEPTSNIWKPTLVILRIERAAIDVKWSGDGQRFAVASGAKCVPVCKYEHSQDWWICKMIKKKFKSTVLCVAFHPTNGQLLATGCADFKCRVFSTFSTDVDGTNVDPGPFGTSLEFGEPYCELGSQSWIHAVAWAPSGNALAYAGHDSVIHVATLQPSPAEQVVRTIRLKGLPMMGLLFLSEKAMVGIGHDFSPSVFVDNTSTGEWVYYDHLDKNKPKANKPAATGTVTSNARALFQNKTDRGQESKVDSDTLSTSHDRVVSSVRAVTTGASGVTSISTSSLDGKLVVWDLPSLEIDMSALGI